MIHEERARKWLEQTWIYPTTIQSAWVKSLTAQFEEASAEAVRENQASWTPQIAAASKRIAELEAMTTVQGYYFIIDAWEAAKTRIAILETELEQKCTNNRTGRQSCIARSGDPADHCSGCIAWSAARAKAK
jgi:hypothetical protein